MLQAIKDRIKNLEQQLEHSVQSHNILLGAKTELENLVKAIETVAPVVEAIEPQSTAVFDAVEAVAKAIE